MAKPRYPKRESAKTPPAPEADPHASPAPTDDPPPDPADDPPPKKARTVFDKLDTWLVRGEWK
jgi:hypothetical protein